MLFLELREMMTVISLLDLPSESRVGSCPVCISSTFIEFPDHFSFAILAEAFSLKGLYSVFGYLAFFTKWQMNAFMWTPLPSCRPSVCDPLLTPKPFVKISRNSVWESFTNVLDEARFSQK
jgi:hypothetical protein